MVSKVPEAMPEKISRELQLIKESQDSKAFHDFCIYYGHEPQDDIEKKLTKRYELENRQLEEPSPIITPQETSGPQRLQSQGPLVLICLGAGDYGNRFLENQRYVAEMIRDTLGKIHPYLNFSETLSIIDGFSKLQEILPYKTTYDALNHINTQFFPELSGRRKELSEEQELRLKKLNIYSGRRNLVERVDAMPKELEEEFRRDVINPVGVKEMQTDVPIRKKKRHGKVYAAIRATEISGIINTFPSHYHPEFC